MRARLRRRGADHQRGGEHDALAAGAFVVHVGRAAGSAKTATQILRGAAGYAGLIDDRFRAGGPVVDVWRAAHRTRSRNMLTCDDNTPPSPCSSAIGASFT